MDKCGICLSDLSCVNLFFLKDCRHYFHESCLRVWVQTLRQQTGRFDCGTCPTCRTPLDSYDMDFLTPAYRHFQCQATLRPTQQNSHFEVVVYEVFDEEGDPTREWRRERIRCDLGSARELPMVSDEEHHRRYRAARAARRIREMRLLARNPTDPTEDELELL